MARPQDRREARARLDHAGDGRRVVDHHPDGVADEFVCRLRASFHRRRATQHAGNTRPARGPGGMADRRQEDPRHLGESSCRPPWTRAEHATEDRRIGPESPGHRRQHWQRPVAISRLIHHRQHRDGIRRIRCARQSSDLRPRRRRRQRRGARETLYGNHPRRRARRHRRRLHAGDPHRVGAAARQRTGAGVWSLITLVLGIAQVPALSSCFP